MSIIAIDPGPDESAFLVWDGRRAVEFQHADNETIMQELRTWACGGDHDLQLVIEEVASYGMPVGREVFQTVFWAGRFCEAFGSHRTHLMPRLTVKMYLCHNSRAKDGNIRQALIDRFGPQGTKKAPGAL